MRDSTMTDDDLAVVAAKENLASLSRRPGYAEAMRPPERTWRMVAIYGAFGLGFALVAIASWENIDATWLRWLVVLLFGFMAMFGALAALGSAPGMETDKRWGVAVLAKSVASGRHELTLLREDGAQVTATASEEVHGLLRPGDCGVVLASGDEAPYRVDKFTRL